jgi:serine/threonine-protein kinase
MPRHLGLVVSGLLAALAVSGCVVIGRTPPPLPHVVGMTVDQAEAAIKAAGFDVAQVVPDDSGSDTTRVTDAYVPEASRMENTNTNRRFQVVIVVGTVGWDPVKVPSVTYVDLDFARESLRSWGLSLGTVTHQFDSTVESGTVLTQSPRAGAVARRGTSVNVVLGAGR